MGKRYWLLTAVAVVAAILLDLGQVWAIDAYRTNLDEWHGMDYAIGTETAVLTAEPGVSFLLDHVAVSINTGTLATDEDLTITRDAGRGEAYDLVIHTDSLSTSTTTLTSWWWAPTRPIRFSADDKIVVDFPNDNGKEWTMEVVYEKCP